MKRITYGSNNGFALPSLLIASFVMMTVLVSAVSATASVSKELDNQYYRRYAKEAAESGVTRASVCLTKDLSVATWSVNSLTLKPETNCDGSVIGGASQYVYTTADFRTKFTVGAVVTTATHVEVTSIGVTELFRQSNTNSVRESYPFSLVVNIPLGVVTSTYSSSGFLEVCGIVDGQTWCWGQNDRGQLGNGTLTDTNVPVRVLRESGALLGKTDKLVAVGNLFACIVTTDNQIYCMGYNNRGQIGDGTLTDSSIPKAVDTTTGLAGKTITEIVANEGSVCATASGDVYCWGNGSYGRLGNGGTTDQTKPVRVSTIGTTNGPTVTALASTPLARFTCAVAAGKAYCWGENDRGQLGDQTTSQRSTPVTVYAAGALSGKTVSGIAAAGGFPVALPYDGLTADKTRQGHVCASTSDGGVYCWGSNQYGQMGQGTSSLAVQSQAVKVNGLLSGKTITQVSTSYSTPCALANDNTMYCWGQNIYGTVGDGTTTVRTSPTQVVVQDPGLLGKTITYISGGVNRNCAVASGTTYCWGRNNTGQLGDGTYTNRYVPTEAIFLKRRLPLLYY